MSIADTSPCLSVGEGLEQISHAFDNGRVSVVLGPLFSAANGFQLLDEFLWSILSEPSPGQALDKQLQTWRAEGAWHRLAQGCVNLLTRKEESFFQRLDSEYGRPIVSGPLYALAQLLPFAALVNMNLDGVLAASRACATSLLPLADEREQALAALDARTPHIVYPLGRAKSAAVPILPFTVFRHRKNELTPYFHTLFSTTDVLLLGFPRPDFTMDWLHEVRTHQGEGGQVWLVDMAPAKRPAHEYPLFQRIALPDPPEATRPASIVGASLRLRNFLVKLLERCDRNDQLAAAYIPELFADGIELNEKLLNEERARRSTPEGGTTSALLEGKPASWLDIVENRDARRDISDELKSWLRVQRLRVALLWGPSGFGKSTVARRVAFELFADAGLKVFWIEDPLLFPDGVADAIHKDDDALVVVDQVQSLGDFHHRLKHWSQAEYRRLRILLVGRRHEVLSGGLHLDALREEAELRIFNLPWITVEESRGFLEKLKTAGILADPDSLDMEQRAQRFTNDTGGDLLASLLVETRGLPLDRIVEDVCARVLAWPGGKDLLLAYALVAAIDMLGKGVCTQGLFFHMTHAAKLDIFEVLNRLPGELSLSLGRSIVSTRHPKVAEIAFGYLTRSSEGHGEPVFAKADLYERIIDAAAAINQEQELKLTSIIPIAVWDREKNKDFARTLFARAHELVPGNAYILQAWGRREAQAGYVAKARELFQRAVKAAPHDAPSLQAWALLEAEVGDVDTARKLFQSAVEADPRSAPSWQAWALLEAKAGEVAKARELFQRAVSADSRHAPSWQAWALLEERQGNAAEARELLRQGIKHAPDDVQLRQTLANWEQAPEQIVTVTQNARIIDQAMSPLVRVVQKGGNESRKAEPLAADASEGDAHRTGSPGAAESLPVSETVFNFVPATITEGFGYEQRRIVCYLLGGLALRLKMPVVLIQFPQGEPEPIYPIEAPYNYPMFCSSLLGTKQLLDWRNHPCRKDMRARARDIYREFSEAKAPAPYIVRSCHAGISALYAPFRLKDQLLGVYIFGKFLYGKDTVNTDSARQILGSIRSHPNLEDEARKALDHAEIDLAKIQKAQQHAGDDSSSPSSDELDFRRFSEAELEYHFQNNIVRGISRIHDAIDLLFRFNRDKNIAASLARHNAQALVTKEASPATGDLVATISESLKTFATLLGVPYVAYFVADEPWERYLPLVAYGSLDGSDCRDVYVDRLEAKIPDLILEPADWRFEDRQVDFVERGLCGSERAGLLSTGLAVGFSHVGHQGLLCIGPFQPGSRPGEADTDSLRSLCFQFGLKTSGIYIAHTQQLKRQREREAYALAVHEIKNGLGKLIDIAEPLVGTVKQSVPSEALLNDAILLPKKVKQLAQEAAGVLRNPDIGYVLKGKHQMGMAPPLRTNEQLNLLAIVMNVFEGNKQAAANRGIALELTDTLPSDAFVRFDPTIFKQMLSCLVDNAITYGAPEQRVDVVLSTGQNMLRVTVVSRGNPISDQKWATLFQGAKARDTSLNTGLGLFLVREAARFGGGDAGLEPYPNSVNATGLVENVFWFSLPLHKENGE